MPAINILPHYPGLVTYDPAFLPRAAADALLAELTDTIPWARETITLYGRERPVPRLIAYYGATDYTYSRRRHPARPLPAALDDLRRQLESVAGARFNSVLLNLYRDGQDSMGWHADDEPELGPAPVIASLSLGAERIFKLRSKSKTPDRAPQTLTLAHGSCLVMGAGLQATHEHAIPKTARPVGPRINFTYRWISEEQARPDAHRAGIAAGEQPAVQPRARV